MSRFKVPHNFGLQFRDISFDLKSLICARCARCAVIILE